VADKTRYIDPFEPDAGLFSFAGPATFGHTTSEEELETERLPDRCQAYGHSPRIQTVNAMKRKWAVAEIGRIPDPGESIHVVTNARFDFWDWTPAILKMAEPRVCRRWYGSTWILNRRNAVELLDLYDQKKILAVSMVTGIYFKRRESSVFATLYEGLKARGQRFKAALNHSKWVAMELDDGTGLVIAGSANFTENGNMEQFVYVNDRGLFDFYAGIADTILDAAD
jgi:hypothetical protein